MPHQQHKGLPNVDAIYTWVRLAQRVPVHVQIVSVPKGVLLVAGMTATVTIRKSQPENKWSHLRTTFADFFRSASLQSEECLESDIADAKPVEVLPARDAPAAGPRPDGCRPDLSVNLPRRSE